MTIYQASFTIEILDEKQPSDSHNTYKSLKTFIKDRPGHDYRYAIDFSKIKEELNWLPEITFEDGIRQTIRIINCR